MRGNVIWPKLGGAAAEKVGKLNTPAMTAQPNLIRNPSTAAPVPGNRNIGRLDGQAA
jgi:hypothetical protein